jgi:hypothetical protein
MKSTFYMDGLTEKEGSEIALIAQRALNEINRLTNDNTMLQRKLENTQTSLADISTEASITDPRIWRKICDK